MGLFSKIQSRLELHRLEKKYTTRRKGTPTCATGAQYVDGEYIYQTPTSPNPSHSNHRHQSREYTSSSATFAASQRQPNPPDSHLVVSFSSPPPSPRAPPNPHYNSSSASGVAKHSSWQSLAPSSIGVQAQAGSPSSPRNSTFTTAGDPPASPTLSRNSKGQSWEPPKHGWGGDGTDAFKGDKREFRFDVERDRRSAGRVD